MQARAIDSILQTLQLIEFILQDTGIIQLSTGFNYAFALSATSEC